MGKNRFEVFLEEIKGKPEIVQKLKGMEPAKNMEEKLKVLLGIARENGYEISEEDLKDYLAGKESARQEKTDAQIAEIENMADEELAVVAGGVKENEECKDTYRDKENCWVNDGCDAVLQRYEGYECSMTQHICPGNMVDKVPDLLSLIV